MDASSFTDLVLSRERSLYRIAYAYLHNDADAADAVQEALLRAWEKRRSLRQQAYFGTWLTRILINVCKQKIRRARPTVPLQEESAVDDGMDNELLALKTAMEQLDFSHRIPLQLYHLEGFSVKEIAGMLRLPKGTVTSRLARARQKLKEALEVQEVKPHV